MLESALTHAISGPFLAVFAVTLTLIYVIKSWLSHPAGLPPMPCRPLPVFGHTLYLQGNMLPTLNRWRKEVGDIMTLYMFGKLTVIISSHQLLTEALVKKADFFSDRPMNTRMVILGGDGDPRKGIVGSSQAPWKEQRSVSMAILRSFGMGRNVMAERIAREVECFVKELTALKGEASDVNILTNSAVSNVICAVISGDRFDYKDPVFLKLLKQNEDVFRLVGPSSILNVFPWLRFLPGDLFGAKKLRFIFSDIRKTFNELFVQKCKATLDDTSEDNYIKAYLREMKKRQEAGEETYLDEQNLTRNIDNLFVAGTDTTSTTILWALIFAMRHPEYQDKIFNEINEVVGTERMPTVQDRSHLHVLNAFVLETQRRASIAPLSVPHCCSQETQVGGYRIPAGAVVIPHLDAVLKDPQAWQDPDAFRPERFLDSNQQLVPTPPEFLPFSLGRRICMGESLARMELYLFLAALFQKFEILPETAGHPPPLDAITAITVSPKPFKVRFQPRH